MLLSSHALNLTARIVRFLATLKHACECRDSVPAHVVVINTPNYAANDRSVCSGSASYAAENQINTEVRSRESTDSHAEDSFNQPPTRRRAPLPPEDLDQSYENDNNTSQESRYKKAPISSLFHGKENAAASGAGEALSPSAMSGPLGSTQCTRFRPQKHRRAYCAKVGHISQHMHVRRVRNAFSHHVV
jgi:hypothetical protein